MTSCFCFIELYLTKTKREYRKNKLCIVYCKVFSILRLYMTFCQNYRCAQQDVLISCICGLMLMNSAMNVITMELTQFFILIEITICLPCLCVIENIYLDQHVLVRFTSYINKKSLATIVTDSAGPHLNLFVSINSFMSIIGIHHLEFKENLFPLLISFKCKARNCYDNQNAPKFKPCLRHTQLILQQES